MYNIMYIYYYTLYLPFPAAVVTAIMWGVVVIKSNITVNSLYTGRKPLKDTLERNAATKS